MSFLTDVINEVTYVDAGLRLDALLLRAAATELAGRDGRDDVRAAESLSPGSRYGLQVSVMAGLNHIMKTSAGGEREELLTKLHDLLLRADKLFSPNDEWLLSAKSAVSGL